MQSSHQLYIDGEWTAATGGGTWDVINPATEEIIETVPFGGAAETLAAIEAAERAFTPWSATTAYERAAVLKATAELIRQRLQGLARLTTQECGKPLVEAVAEWTVAANIFEWFGEEAKRNYGRTIPSSMPGKRLFVLHQPLGVVGVITAWNFPAYNTSRSWAAALAAGCTVVAKPSEYTPLTAMEIVAMLAEAGAPPGVINLVNGDPDAIGRTLLEQPSCRKISFTGSVRVGRILMDGASRTFTKLALELGGNAPVLVFEDVDVEAVARGAVRQKFRNNGQVCVSPQRFVVHESIRDQFVDCVSEETVGLTVGDGLSDDTDVGPLINATQRERVETLVGDAVQGGATVLVGGSRPAGLERGYFFEPTVLDGIADDHRLLHEEIFGPVLPSIKFADLDEALACANATDYGLAAYVWTNDLNTAVRAYEQLEFGMVAVNEWTPGATEAPFGGWKQSGMGRELGKEGLKEYLETKLVSIHGKW